MSGNLTHGTIIFIKSLYDKSLYHCIYIERHTSCTLYIVRCTLHSVYNTITEIYTGDVIPTQ